MAVLFIDEEASNLSPSHMWIGRASPQRARQRRKMSDVTIFGYAMFIGGILLGMCIRNISLWKRRAGQRQPLPKERSK
jgi:hypothetical protein